MQLRNYILVTALMTGALLFFGSGNSAVAQLYPMQPPFMAPGISTTRTGMFYFNAGVRYRNIQTFTLSRQEGTTASGTQGTPPFGPDDGIPVGGAGFGTPIPFGTGTGTIGLQAFPLNPTYLPAGDPRTSGIWFYQNGAVSALASGATIDSTCTDSVLSPPDLTCTTVPQNWVKTYPDFLTGRHTVTLTGTGTCCDITPTTQMVGFFGFNDSSTQTDNPGSITSTRTISYQWIIDGSYNATYAAASGEVASLVASIPRLGFGPIAFQEKVWCPSFEAGMQFGSYFDVFTGLSFYNAGNTINTSFVAQGSMGRRAFTDTFPFSGDQASTAWPLFPFRSDSTLVNGAGVNNFQISVDGELNSLFPTRTFFFAPLAGTSLETMQDDIAQRADFDVFEFRFGGRSWIPLYGMGRFGVFAGTLASRVSYTISGSELVTSLGPNFTGQTLYSAIAKQSDSAWSWGLFAGSDVEIGLGRWFAKGSIEYSVAQEISYSLLSTTTNFRPSGLQIALSGGVGF